MEVSAAPVCSHSALQHSPCQAGGQSSSEGLVASISGVLACRVAACSARSPMPALHKPLPLPRLCRNELFLTTATSDGRNFPAIIMLYQDLYSLGYQHFVVLAPFKSTCLALHSTYSSPRNRVLSSGPPQPSCAWDSKGTMGTHDTEAGMLGLLKLK